MSNINFLVRSKNVNNFVGSSIFIFIQWHCSVDSCMFWCYMNVNKRGKYLWKVFIAKRTTRTSKTEVVLLALRILNVFSLSAFVLSYVNRFNKLHRIIDCAFDSYNNKTKWPFTLSVNTDTIIFYIFALWSKSINIRICSALLLALLAALSFCKSQHFFKLCQVQWSLKIMHHH